MSAYQDHEGQHRGPATGNVYVDQDAQDRAMRLHLAQVWESRCRVARQQIIAVAMSLAEHGLPADLIAASLADMAVDAGKRAAVYIEAFDAREAADIAADLADRADDYARGADEEAAQ